MTPHGLAVATCLACLPAAAPVEADTVADAQRAAWQELARHGDSQAAFSLGTLAEQTGDAAASLCWYRQAGAGGVADAAFNVAVMHDSGRGVAADPKAAATWYARAALAGSHRAEFNLGQLYDSGEGVPRNPPVAAAWYRRAGAGGIAAAAERAAAVRPVRAGDADAKPLAASLDPVLGAAGSPATFTWAAPAQPVPVTYVVEIVSTLSPLPVPVSLAGTELPATRQTLAEGEYAARVFSVAADGAHYAVGPWTRFAIAVTPDLPACDAAAAH